MKTLRPQCSLALVGITAGLATGPALHGQVWTTEGRELNWTMNVPNGWVGGNFYEIRDFLSRQTNPTWIAALRELEDLARDTDAVFAYIVDETPPPVSTVLTIRASPPEQGIPYAAMNAEVVESLAAIERDRLPPGTELTVTSIDSGAVVGGHRAYRFVIEFRSATSGRYYEIRHIVFLPGRNHFFVLKVHESVRGPREAELNRMLASLRYR